VRLCATWRIDGHPHCCLAGRLTGVSRHPNLEEKLVMTRELICDNKAGSSSTGAPFVQHAKKALIPAIASLCLAAFQVQAQEANPAAQPAVEEPAEVVLPMTVITPTPGNAQDAQGDTRFQPNADITGNCGRVIFRKVSRVGRTNHYSVRVISSIGPMSTIFYTASTFGDTAAGAVSVYGATERFFTFTLRNPFNVTALLNGFANHVNGVTCIFLPNPA
jgi:hypothetical protein